MEFVPVGRDFEPAAPSTKGFDQSGRAISAIECLVKEVVEVDCPQDENVGSGCAPDDLVGHGQSPLFKVLLATEDIHDEDTRRNALCRETIRDDYGIALTPVSSPDSSHVL